MNSNPSVYDDGKEKFSIWKRMLIFLIDGIMVVGVVIALFLTVCDKSISHFAKNEVNNLNEMYQTLCDQKESLIKVNHMESIVLITKNI